MIVWIKKGNIFEVKNVQNYAHGCNCSGVMGKGIALQFKKKFPEMYLKYRRLCLKNELVIGNVYTYKHELGYVFNLATQESWRKKATLPAIEEALTNMISEARKLKISQIVIPKIGAGLGGLDWNEVKNIIKGIFDYVDDITLYVVENYK